MEALPSNIAREIDNVNRLSDTYVKRKFTELFGAEPTFNAVGEIRSMVIYKLQENYYGGLSKSQKEALLKPFAQPHEMDQLLPGTVIRKSWHGTDYEVIVRANRKFEFNGAIYRSLSAIAKVITGAHRSGKTFFGVA